jgi:hypothetical protein
MEIFASSIEPTDPQFQQNQEYHRGLGEELRQRLGEVRQGGGVKYRERHEAQGKLFVRERINRLLDPARLSWNFRRWLLIVSMRTRLRVLVSSPGSGELPGVKCWLSPMMQPSRVVPTIR